MEKYLAPNGYDIPHWAGVVLLTFVVWEVLKWLRSKIKA